MIKKLLLLLLFCSSALAQNSKSHQLHITVIGKDGTGPLPNAHVSINDHWGVTDEIGNYSTILDTNQALIIVDYVSYNDTSFNIELDPNTKIEIALRPRNELLTQVEVTDKRLNRSEEVLQTQILTSTVTPKDVAALAMIGGEPDILKPLQSLPGVQAGMPGSADIYVRGSDQYQNSIMLDGFPIYNISHAFGYASAIPVSGVQKLDFYKQAYPVEYSNGTASFSDVTVKRGNAEKWTDEIGLGIGSVRGNINGPLNGGQSGIMASARISTMGLTRQAARLFGEDFGYVFDYNDILSKYHHRFDNDKLIEFIGYISTDGVEIKTTEEDGYEDGINSKLQMRNYLIGATYHNSWKNNWLNRQKLYWSNYTYKQKREDIKIHESDVELNYRYNVNNFGWEDRLTKTISKGSHVSMGAEANLAMYGLPYVNQTSMDTSQLFEQQLQIDNVYSFALFADWDKEIFPFLKLNIGLRGESWVYDSKFQIKPLPRTSLRLIPSKTLAFFIAYDRTAQGYHRFRNNDYASAVDFPLPPSEHLPIEVTDQFSIGGTVAIVDNLHFDIQTYYKKLHNAVDRDYSRGVLIYSDEENQIPNPNPSHGLIAVNGSAYGIETSARWEYDIFKVNAAYTWSKAFRQNDMLNLGREYPFEFNREHYVKADFVTRFRQNSLKKIAEIGLSWMYGTGFYTHFPLQFQQMDQPRAFPDISNNYSPGVSPGSIAPWYYIPSRNNLQLPNIHRLDLNINFITQKKHGIRTLSISIFNVYFSKVIARYVYHQGRLMGEGPFVFLPTVTYSYKF